MIKRHGKFDIVANFAAHKHVRSEKDGFSIEAMIKNNVISAKKFLDYLVINKPSHFFCVSTDKAANPVNVMGLQKVNGKCNYVLFQRNKNNNCKICKCCIFKRILTIRLYQSTNAKTTNFVTLISAFFCIPKKVVKSAY